MIRQYYKDADAGFASTIDVGVILTIRWVAIIGQGAALLFTHLFLQLDLPLLPALFVISLSVVVNLWQIMQSPQSRQRQGPPIRAGARHCYPLCAHRLSC